MGQKIRTKSWATKLEPIFSTNKYLDFLHPAFMASFSNKKIHIFIRFITTIHFHFHSCKFSVFIFSMSLRGKILINTNLENIKYKAAKLEKT